MGDTGEKSTGPGPGPDDEVKPYKIHIPTRHVDLTRRKLEFTRLPHEAEAEAAVSSSGPKDRDGGGGWKPKAQVEELIDYWVEKYSWRDQESVLNTAFPQFRASVSLDSLPSPVRIHFIHVRSAHPSAVPLLLLPPFPFTNLSLAHLVQPLTAPADPTTTQPFHLVIPSLPGLGFSDALPNLSPTASPIPATAALLDALMTTRLAYPRYLATTAAPGATSPARIDWRLIRCLATRHASSCAGAHFISPAIDAPDVRVAPWEWAKWRVARFLRAGILGYEEEDFALLDGMSSSSTRWIADGGTTQKSKGDFGGEEGMVGIAGLGRLTQPDALAYALCDSPVGMLVFILRALRLAGIDSAREEENDGGFFDKDWIITLTQLAWLPGPEHALRFWAACETAESFGGSGDEVRRNVRASVAISGFKGECPAWANAEYDVLQTTRYPGRTGSKTLLAFEAPDIVFAGVRGLAGALLAKNPRIFELDHDGVAPLEKVVVIKDDDEGKTTTTQPVLLPPNNKEQEKGKGKGQATTTTTQRKFLGVPEVLATPAITPIEEEDEEDRGKLGAGVDKVDKGKGKEVVVQDLSPPAPIPVRDPLLDGESPDTLVEGSKTPPLEKAS
ncbi:epoxide hydrolase [Echria macrotheca]|uniref:Epoxide hydrolase n=1 Tax=Echria macrotheca TaxID=438768 RepID=A0AAJ0BP53_9PEZI|nr:epoxide hydrolase [Echria macrotheca]